MRSTPVHHMHLIVAVVGMALVLPVGADTARMADAQPVMQSPPDFQTVVSSHYDFEETVAMLKGAIEGENLMVIQEINPQQMLRMVGVHTQGIRQILFFHPRYMQRLREVNAHATIEPPLKIAVMATPQGTRVTYVKPTYLFGRYAGAEAIGSELEALVTTIVATVQQ